MTEVVIIDTGVANTASLLAAFRRLGFSPVLTRDPDRVSNAERAVLPGVGAFAAGMSGLCATGMDEAVRMRVERDTPTLAICLGMQLLCASSEESPGVHGLGILTGAIERFPDTVRVPQFGWNAVRFETESSSLNDGYAYFANSYCLRQRPDGWESAISEHGGEFVAAIRNGRVLACQFHPELSGAWGQSLLGVWASEAEMGALC